MKTIFEACLDDPNRRIYKYFKSLEAPTYEYARYWDWIRPWIESELATNTKNQHI